MCTGQRVALITGAGNGIGEAIARKFTDLGITVIVNDINEASALRVADDIVSNGGRAMAYRADVSQKNEVEKMFEAVIERFGTIDILVNNAGMGIEGKIEEMTEEDWDRVIRVNLKSCFLCTKAAVKHFIQKKYGRIVNISSRLWLGGVGQASYSAAKGGIVSLTRTCAIELMEHNVTVNCVAPGAIAVPRFYRFPKEKQRAILDSQFVPGRIGKPEDVAHAVAFFASEEAGYITGQILHVCGGKSLEARW